MTKMPKNLRSKKGLACTAMRNAEADRNGAFHQILCLEMFQLLNDDSLASVCCCSIFFIDLSLVAAFLVNADMRHTACLVPLLGQKGCAAFRACHRNRLIPGDKRTVGIITASPELTSF